MIGIYRSIVSAGQQHGNSKTRVIGRPFPKGTSGNPSGRPKGSVSPTTALRAALTSKAAGEVAAAIVQGAKKLNSDCLRILFDRLDAPLSGPLAVSVQSVIAPVSASETIVELRLPRNFTEAIFNGDPDAVDVDPEPKPPPLAPDPSEKIRQGKPP